MQRLNYDFIEQFDECWVPDTAGEPSLAGVLSHPEKLPSLPTTYIGPLFRIQKPAEEVAPKHLLVVLSGPEPQRSILEELLLEQLKTYEGPVLIVRALPGGSEESVEAGNLTIINHLDANALEKAMQEASLDIWSSKYQLKTKTGEPVDKDINATYERVAKAIDELKEHCTFVKVLGSYPNSE